MEFDAFCHLAQLELFENLFFQYNKWLNNQHRHIANNGFADIPKNIQEQIDNFSEFSTPANFTYNTLRMFGLMMVRICIVQVNYH